MTNTPSSRTPVVLYDATSIPANRGGVGRVIESTIPLLAQREQFELHVVCKPEHETEFKSLASYVHLAPDSTSRASRRLIWEQTGLPRLAQKVNAALVFSPHYTFPLRGRFARVVMIHDLTFFSLPQLHSTSKKLFFKWWLHRLARRHDIRIVAPSRATAQAFAQLDPQAHSRLTVAHLGYDTGLFCPPTSAEIQKFIAPISPPVNKWIAFLGTLEPRKNVPALIDAFSSLPLAQSGKLSLLLSGGAGWDTEVEPAISRAHSQGVDVRTLGYLPQEQLKAFLGGAEIVTYPSLGEGFGLPVLEAMACGTPVLTTRELSLPEVGGDAALYCGTDSASIAVALEKFLGASDMRTSLREKGLSRAQEFSWDKTAQSMAEAIQLALAEADS